MKPEMCTKSEAHDLWGQTKQLLSRKIARKKDFRDYDEPEITKPNFSLYINKPMDTIYEEKNTFIPL